MNYLISPNVLGIVVATVVSMVVGFVWYSPKVFGTMWMGLIGKKMEGLKSGANSAYAVMAVFSLVTAYFLSVFLSLAAATTPMEGATVGFLAWLGFVATTMGSGHLFEGRPRNLYLINAGFHLVNFVLMGAVLTLVG